MYIPCYKYVKEDLEEQKKILARFEKRIQSLKNCNGCIITKKAENGRVYNYIQVYQDGKKKQFAVRNNRIEEFEQIREKNALKVAIRRCKRNITLMEPLVKAYEGLTNAEINSELIPVYRDSPNYSFALYGKAGAKAWLRKHQAIKDSYPPYRPEELIHTAIGNILTRSKSEALIIGVLIALQIPFIYECPMIIDGELICPDILCLNERTGAEIIIEHMGMMGNSAYSKKQYQKLSKYINAGIVPNVNLILTFDTGDGKINVQAIMEELRFKLK